MSHLYGRLPAQRPRGLGFLSEYVAGKLPPPPPQAHYGALVHDFPMFLNDQFGDCTVAAAAHLVQVWNAIANEHDPVPTDDEVRATYFGLTGGQDTGLVEANVLKAWHQSGFWGRKIAGYAPVQHDSLTAVHQSVAFYGGCYLGIVVTEQMERQFAAGEQWTPDPNGQVLGGHAVPIVGYDQHELWVVTWGKLQSITYPFLGAMVEEAWCVLPDQFQERGHGPREIAWADLQKDLARV